MMNVQEMIDIDFLQKVQDTFAKATGFAAVTVDFRGNPITKYSNFSPFCSLVRQDPRFVDSCLKCDAYGGLEAARREKPHVYHCHAGLVDFAVPIIVKGKLVGSMLAGQVTLHELDNGKLSSITNDRSSWEENEEIAREYANIPSKSYEKIYAAAEMMFYVINNMFEKDMRHYVKEEWNEKKHQMIDQLKVQANLEQELTEKHKQPSHSFIDPHFLFTAMNTLSCLAIIEKAPQTQDTILTLTAMMNYMLTTNESRFVPLGEEMDYIEQYVKLQNVRFKAELYVLMDIPEEYQSIFIPSFILYSIINQAIQHKIESKMGHGKIVIKGYVYGDDFIIEVSDHGMSFSKEQLADLYDVSHYGRNYTLTAHPNLEGGTTVKIRIPNDGVEGSYRV
ncbi:PocR ligand-binding domain-containing protein [Pseudobacillus sp. FSL P4-0506]|uniref:PocR ligand-binding domain-containing protein n=1 Tax=Pseudobacillus sp. FSL P4-0506 TaxID=2921576 RepID=UPI0030F7BFEC